jgi:NhaA family Na+:H+ antiporter
MYRVWNFITNYSILLISGAIIALIWANINPNSYHHFVEFPLWFNDHIGLDYSYWAKSFGTGYADFDGAGSLKVLSLHYLVNDMLMAFFFAIAAKEVWEAVILKNGSLRGKKAATPLFATLGGMLGPVSVYLVLAAFMGSDTYNAVANGWAIPTATDIAFSYLVGRLVFGAGHPAVRFLLLLAIADDAAGLIILAVFYPQGDLARLWLSISPSTCCRAFWMQASNCAPHRPGCAITSAFGPTYWPLAYLGMGSCAQACIPLLVSCPSFQPSLMQIAPSEFSQKPSNF